MPFFPVPEYKLELFWALNPRPDQLVPTATPPSLSSHPVDPDLPVLVLCHAAGSNVLGWAGILRDARLSSKYNILLVDAPFHGFSTADERTEHTLEDSANCIDHLQLQRFAVYGEGVHGASTAVWLTIKRPEKITGLLIASPGWRDEEASVKTSLVEVEQAIALNKPGEGGDDSGSLPAEAVEDILCYCIGSSKRMAEQRRKMGEYFEARYGAGKPAFELRLLFHFVYNRRPIPAEDLARVTCPVLILRGRDDKIVTPVSACEEWQRAFTSAKGGANLVAVSSAPAIISLAEGGILSRLMAQFFATCTEPAGEAGA
ncbi:hypothetical protein JCM10213_008102 [Rhodosporidiobolus nylandii]